MKKRSGSHNLPLAKNISGLEKDNTPDSVRIICDMPNGYSIPDCCVVSVDPTISGKMLNKLLAGIEDKYLFLFLSRQQINLEPGQAEEFISAAESTGAGIVYADFFGEYEWGKIVHPLNNYQKGSVRDDFDFGGIMLFSMQSVRAAIEKYGRIPDVKYAGLYDLRLKVSIDNTFMHINKPLYSVIEKTEPSENEKHFAYVDPKNAGVQKEMEAVFMNYLKKIGAYIPPEYLRQPSKSKKYFPVEASVVIPVRNRAGTIADAVKSAMSQKTDFAYNVIVVDNHSTDGTTSVLSAMAGKYPVLAHIVPERTDLGIGGCWNEAIYSSACGRYAVQLDSDDLYGNAHVIQRIVDVLHDGKYAMVVGSYTIVDFNLNSIPPGLIDHREWTYGNGHNNALRINGLGAPRAFDTSIIRKIGFPNVSYGEDYAVALRISRKYRIGRIYESLYLCRRWQGNTDAALTFEETNSNNAFKDKIRTEEILARQEMMKEVKGLQAQEK